MNLQQIAAAVDHTVLAQTARWEDIKTALDDGIKYHVASVCLPPSYVKQARDYVGDALPICTVIGFPNGYNPTAVKAMEAARAVDEGAGEIDMVINLGWVKDGLWEQVEEELSTLRKATKGKILKVIIETCLLTEEEKIKLCQLVTSTGADFIKTSTGFAGGGATPGDIILFSQNIGPNVRIKAAGGISNLEDAQRFLNLGAHRLGTSRIIKLLRQQPAQGY